MVFLVITFKKKTFLCYVLNSKKEQHDKDGDIWQFIFEVCFVLYCQWLMGWFGPVLWLVGQRDPQICALEKDREMGPKTKQQCWSEEKNYFAK